MDQIAAHLIEKETITGREFMEIYCAEKGIPVPEPKNPLGKSKDEKKDEKKEENKDDSESAILASEAETNGASEEKTDDSDSKDLIKDKEEPAKEKTAETDAEEKNLL